MQTVHDPKDTLLISGDLKNPGYFFQIPINGHAIKSFPELRLILPQFQFSRIRIINVREQFFPILVCPEPDGGYITRIETPKYNATGQGETEEEAIKDITFAIELLMDEDKDPSGEIPWPRRFQ